jgi:monoamine oxidase
MTRLELRTTILAQLDRIFGNGSKPASDSYIDMVVQDWTKDRFIRGGYSSPSFYVSAEDRDYIASPVQHTLFFAGEYTSSNYMVMQSAMESGVRVANEIIRVLQSKL